MTKYCVKTLSHCNRYNPHNSQYRSRPYGECDELLKWNKHENAKTVDALLVDCHNIQRNSSQ